MSTPTADQLHRDALEHVRNSEKGKPATWSRVSGQKYQKTAFSGQEYVTKTQT